MQLTFAGSNFICDGLSATQCEALAALYPALPAGRAIQSAPMFTRTRSGVLPTLTRQDFTRDGVYHPHCRYSIDRVEIDAFDFSARLELGKQVDGELWSDREAALAERMVFENYLRIAGAYQVLWSGGLLLHSSAVLHRGRAWLFVGRSGAGKTTLARKALAAGMEVFSDDANVVLPAADADFVVVPVPFAGELGAEAGTRMAPAPLGGLCWINGNHSPALEYPGAAVQVARLLACCPVVNSDRYRQERVLDVVQRLLASVPMKVLNCRAETPIAAILSLLDAEADRAA